MTLNHEYSLKKFFVMSYTLKILLGLEIDISLIKDIVKTLNNSQIPHSVIARTSYLLSFRKIF